MNNYTFSSLQIIAKNTSEEESTPILSFIQYKGIRNNFNLNNIFTNHIIKFLAID